MKKIVETTNKKSLKKIIIYNFKIKFLNLKFNKKDVIKMKIY